MTVYSRIEDGSLEDSEGNTVFFSLDRFKSDICEGNFCFLCGASPDEKEFNDEHIIPRWLLRKLGIFNLEIALPNDRKVRYAKYTIPCCIDCNSFLGDFFETEISEAFSSDYNYFCNYLKSKGSKKLFLWLCLVFIKTHLNDSYLRMHLDSRKGDHPISQEYEWGFLHHIHCMVRAELNGVEIHPDCYGSTIILPAKTGDHIEKYDYRDVYAANTILIRINDIAILSVLDDSCASSHFFSGHLDRITGQLSPIQLREVLSHLTLLNYKLKHRPKYYTRLSPTGRVSIYAELPESMELEDHTREELGEILFANVFQYVEAGISDEEGFTSENIRKGGYHFLFNENGDFIENSMEPKP